MKKRLTFLFFLALTIPLVAVLPGLTDAQIHIVQPKETLSKIARQYHTSVAELKAANALSSDLIRVNQKLTIPSAARVPEEAPQEAPAVVITDTTKAKLCSLPEADRWKLHLFLDRALFAPGKIDGLCGEFTIKAAERWVSAHPGETLESLTAKASAQFSQTHSAQKIPASAAEYIGTLPAETKDRAARKFLPYESLMEYMAERFHTDISSLRRLNPGRDLIALKIGDSLQVPDVQPFMIESWPSTGLAKTKNPGHSLRILHHERLIEVIATDGSLVACFPITVGSKPEHLRSGDWEIRSLVPNPTFLWDDLMLKEGRKGSQQFLLPPGPNNPVGVLWMEIEPIKGPEAHIGIHGTAESARIGRNQSSGCIRLANWDIVRLAKGVGKGTRISWQAAPALIKEPTMMASNAQ
jgi:lipoprotein-anchoring transpeptidase ErfK/SrfK